MKAAGCIVIGKTNTPEFGLGSHTFNEVFGVTRNAYDHDAVGRRQQRRRGGRAGARACSRSPTAATSWAACATRRRGTTCSASGRARAACRGGRSATSGSRSSAPKARWGARCATSRCCSTCRPATTRARRCRSPSARRVRRRAATTVDPRGARIGWLGDLGGHLPMEPGILEVCDAGLRRSQALGCAVEPRARLLARASLGGVARRGGTGWSRARLAPYLANPAHRALIKPEALWEDDQAAADRRRRARGERRAHALLRAACCALFDRFDVLVLPTRAGVAVRRRAALADGDRRPRRWTPTTAGWRS